MAVRKKFNPMRAQPVTEILHFGWCNLEERQQRYERYAKLDGGRYHNNSHIQSILAPEVQLRGREWPVNLQMYRALVEVGAGRIR